MTTFLILWPLYQPQFPVTTILLTPSLPSWSLLMMRYASLYPYLMISWCSWRSDWMPSSLSDVSSYELRLRSSELYHTTTYLLHTSMVALKKFGRREEVVLPSGEMTFEASVMRHGSPLALCLNWHLPSTFERTPNLDIHSMYVLYLGIAFGVEVVVRWNRVRAKNRMVATTAECGLLPSTFFIYTIIYCIPIYYISIKSPILSPYRMHMTLLAARPRP